MTIGEVLGEAAQDAGVRATDVPGGGTAFLAGDVTVAATTADGSTAEFRLDPIVAAAAQRTPDTSASDRGPDWVRFSPADLDQYALDRAVAWLGSAARRAQGA